MQIQSLLEELKETKETESSKRTLLTAELVQKTSQIEALNEHVADQTSKIETLNVEEKHA
jgi:hypothetical protein